MGFSFFQSSRSKSVPANLYFFRYGESAASFYAYTDAEQPITIPNLDFGDPWTTPVTYVPTPIDRSDYALSGTLDKTALSIMLPQSSDLAELFRIRPPSYVVNVVIREIEIYDPAAEAKIYWTGRVLGSSRADNQAKLTCEPVSTSIRRNGLRRNFQYNCPLALYGTLCNADKAAATTVVIPTGFDSTTITVDPAWADAANAALYAGGMAVWQNANGDDVIRTILQVGGTNQFLLAGSTTGFILGNPVSLIRGCTHDQPGCNTHNNIQNYGGCFAIPTVNPVSNINLFY